MEMIAARLITKLHSEARKLLLRIHGLPEDRTSQFAGHDQDPFSDLRRESALSWIVLNGSVIRWNCISSSLIFCWSDKPPPGCISPMFEVVTPPTSGVTCRVLLMAYTSMVS